MSEMKRHILLFICAVTLATRVSAQVGAIDPNRPGHEHEYPPSHYGAASEQEQETKQKYTCPMHPEVVTDHPGKCPKCGMKLVPLKEAKRPTSNSDKSRARVQRPTPSHPSHETHQRVMEMSMHSSVNLADPMNREGSGT